MLHQRARISMGRDDRQLPIRRRHRERRHPARNGLHDVVQDNLADGRETRRIGERARQVPRDSVEHGCRRNILAIGEYETLSELAKDNGARRPVAVDNQDHWRIGLTCKTNKRPVAIEDAPHFDVVIRSGAYAIKGMRTAVDVYGNRRLGRRFGHDDPLTTVLTRDADFGLNYLANQRNEVVEELPWLMLRADLLPDLE
jgi:hypothetical protein